MEIRPSDIEAIIKKINIIGDISEINGEMSFEEIGMDSLDQMNLFLDLEEKFGIKISDEVFDRLNNINDIIAFFKEL